MAILLVGILPILIFVIVDTFASLRTALIVATAFAVAEAVFTYFYFGQLDSVTFFTLVTVIGFAFLSYRAKSAIFFKLQPVLVSLLFGAVLVGSYLLDHSLLLDVFNKYVVLLPQDIKQDYASVFLFYQTAIGQRFLELVTLTSGIALFFHAALTAYAAYKLSNWAWLAMRAVGFYVFLAIGAFSVRFLI